MKKFCADIEWWRESFSGHDYRDGNQQVRVLAINLKSAERKVRRICDRDTKGWSQSRWYKLREIFEE